MSILAQIHWWLPYDLSEHGWQIDRLIDWLHVFMAVLFVGWGIFFVYCLVKFRCREGGRARYEPIKAKASKAAEIVVIGIEVVLLVFLSMPVMAEYKNEPPAPEDNPLEIHVIAQQFAWNVHYAGLDGKFGRRDPGLVDPGNPIGLDRDHDPDAVDDIVMNNEMHIPDGRDVIVKLTSKDVIHSFSVPMLRVKQDVVPGMLIPIWFKAREGETSAKYRDLMARTVPIPPEGADTSAFELQVKNNVTLEAYTDKDGNEVLAKDYLEPSVDDLPSLRGAGVGEIRVGPLNPVEIQCAQLCGLTHYQMRGALIIETPAEFEAWIQEQGQADEMDEDLFED